ncbi:MAG TPA: transcription termination factor Rho [Deltaproteobacteria bacterium]|jgi:cysteinyl-tRNA synthetase|nr:transcription termination factor Rho [Deltaproteobacteria bacterium]
MGKKEKEKKEKPLDKMTAKELRELAMTTGAVVGVHAMNKAELIAAIKEERGIVDEKGKKKATDVRDLKAKIKDLQDKRQKAVEDGRFKLADSFRRRISNLKKKTRRAA